MTWLTGQPPGVYEFHTAWHKVLTSDEERYAANETSFKRIAKQSQSIVGRGTRGRDRTLKDKTIGGGCGVKF